MLAAETSDLMYREIIDFKFISLGKQFFGTKPNNFFLTLEDTEIKEAYISTYTKIKTKQYYLEFILRIIIPWSISFKIIINRARF